MNVTRGLRLVHSETLPWTGPEGSGVHRIRCLIEVTDVDGGHAKWRTVKVLEQSGVPTDGARRPASTGGFRVEALAELVSVGLYETLIPGSTDYEERLYGLSIDDRSDEQLIALGFHGDRCYIHADLCDGNCDHSADHRNACTVGFLVAIDYTELVQAALSGRGDLFDVILYDADGFSIGDVGFGRFDSAVAFAADNVQWAEGEWVRAEVRTSTGDGEQPTLATITRPSPVAAADEEDCSHADRD